MYRSTGSADTDGRYLMQFRATSSRCSAGSAVTADSDVRRLCCTDSTSSLQHSVESNYEPRAVRPRYIDEWMYPQVEFKDNGGS